MIIAFNPPNSGSSDKKRASNIGQFGKHPVQLHPDFVSDQVMFIVPMQFECFDCLGRLFHAIQNHRYKCNASITDAAIPV